MTRFESPKLEFVDLNSIINKLDSNWFLLFTVIQQLKSLLSTLDGRVSSLEKGGSVKVPEVKKAAPAKKEEDDDIDLFGSDDEEDEEAEKGKFDLIFVLSFLSCWMMTNHHTLSRTSSTAREERAKAAAEKKKKKNVIAKSNVILDIKPWDDETNMELLEKEVRSIAMDGLLWGISKLVPVAFGVKKLQIVCVVEDDKVSIEELTEKLEAIEEYIQSVDVAAFQKI